MKTIESHNCPKRKNQKKRRKEKRKKNFSAMHIAFKKQQLPAFRNELVSENVNETCVSDTPNLIS